MIAVDREPSAPGFRYADRRAIVSTEDESGIERLAGAERIDGLIAPGSTALHETLTKEWTSRRTRAFIGSPGHAARTEEDAR